MEIRPYEFGISHAESASDNGGIITLKIDSPHLFTVEINGLQSTLAVFANPPYVYESRKGDIVFKKAFIVPLDRARERRTCHIGGGRRGLRCDLY